jgi:hypothetical protein
MNRWTAVAALAALVALPAAAQTGDFPNRPVRIIVPQTAGGAMTEFKDCDVDDTGDVDKFKKLPGIVCQVIGRNVASVTFKMLPISTTRQSQALEFQIKYKSGEQEQLEYGTATVRVPQAPPS